MVAELQVLLNFVTESPALPIVDGLSGRDQNCFNVVQNTTSLRMRNVFFCLQVAVAKYLPNPKP